MRESRLKNEKENVLPAPQHDECSYVLTLFLFRLISLSLSRALSLSLSLSLLHVHRRLINSVVEAVFNLPLCVPATIRGGLTRCGICGIFPRLWTAACAMMNSKPKPRPSRAGPPAAAGATGTTSPRARVYEID